MATHSSVLAWRIPGTAEPGGLPYMGSHSQARLKQLSSSSRTKGKNPSSEGMVSLLPVGQVTGFDPFSSTISFNLHTTLTFLLLSPFYR